MNINDRQSIRRSLIAKREALNEQQQNDAALSLVEQSKQHALLKNTSTVGLYISHKGEISTSPLIHHLWQQNIDVCVPVLHPFCQGHLLFLRYNSHSPMRKNQYGINEPILDITELVLLNEIDTIFTPLVGFDASGNRIGMGGGYYDRTLARASASRSKVIGLAHDCQFIEQLPVESWDVPIKNILTPSHYYQF